MSNQRLMVSLLAALAAMSWLGAETHAQGRGRGFGGFGGAEGIRMRLLGIDKVREALNLSDEQKPELTKVTTTYREEMQGFFGGLQNLSQEERAKKFAEIDEKTKANWEKCEKILTSEQVERVKQISRQARGANALDDEDVKLALKLSDDQKKQLETIREAAGQEMRAAFQQAAGDRDAARKKATEIRKSAGEKALAVLSDEQKNEFKNLQGEKIELPEDALFGPPRR
ncbi:MAG TPA: hypothetical protein VMV69_00770 [Pirellulales bacterium]|nr:hypothetical protein [Pirellulales bacterium]